MRGQLFLHYPLRVPHCIADRDCSSCYIPPEEILNLKFLYRVIILVIKVHVVTVNGIALIYHPKKS